MNRRDFLFKAAAGVNLPLLSQGFFAGRTTASPWKSYDFRPFRDGQFPVPVVKVTPDDGFYIHTFYDVCPWSPSGKMLALTRLPYQGKKPAWGDTAGVCLVDLQNRRIREIYRTRAWSFQLGANVQWDSVSDRYIYTNDIINDEVVCVRIDLENEEVRVFAGSKYDVAPDGRSVVSPNLLNMNIHQYGYAVPDGPGGRPVPFTLADMEREGLWHTDLETNTKKMLVPMKRFFETADDKDRYAGSTGYLFHSKFNRQNTRILQVFRAQVGDKGRNASLFSMNTNGTGLTQCLTAGHWNQIAQSGGSGNHPNWHPDGEHIIMNCVPAWLGFREMMFCRFRYDGSGFTILSEKHRGSGHPSVESSGRYLVADAYPKQSYVSSENGEVAIRMLDTKDDTEVRLCNVPNDVGGGVKQSRVEDAGSGGSHYKLDPHPAWSRDYRQLCFNGAPKGQRQVFIADLKKLML